VSPVTVRKNSHGRLANREVWGLCGVCSEAMKEEDSEMSSEEGEMGLYSKEGLEG
jgi:hypothetical protein